MTTIEAQRFEKIDFSGETLSWKEYAECVFEKCQFRETVLENTKFTSCQFIGCEFVAPKVKGCRFQDVLFKDCKLSAFNFFLCYKTLFSIQCEHSILLGCNFSHLKTPKTHFNACQLKECVFVETDLQHARFSESRLDGTQFHHCLLSHADFSTATHYTIDPLTNKLTKAKFSLPEAFSLLNSLGIEIV